MEETLKPIPYDATQEDLSLIHTENPELFEASVSTEAPPVVEAEDDSLFKIDKTVKMQFGDAVEFNFRKNMLTDTVLSERRNYNTTARKILGEEYFNGKEGVFSFDLSKESVDELNSRLLKLKETDFDANGKIKANDEELRMWHELTKRGYNTDSFHKEVIADAREDYKKLAVHLHNYDENNNWGESLWAEMGGSVQSFFMDPINVAALGTELAVFAKFGNPEGILYEGPTQFVDKKIVEKAEGYKGKTRTKLDIVKSIGLKPEQALVLTKRIIEMNPSMLKTGYTPLIDIEHNDLKKLEKIIKYELKNNISLKDTPEAKAILNKSFYKSVKQTGKLSVLAGVISAGTQYVIQKFTDDHKAEIRDNLKFEPNWDSPAQQEELLYAFGGGLILAGAGNVVQKAVINRFNRLSAAERKAKGFNWDGDDLKKEITELVKRINKDPNKEVPRGRPKGSKNKPKTETVTPETVTPKHKQEPLSSTLPHSNHEAFKSYIGAKDTTLNELINGAYK